MPATFTPLLRLTKPGLNDTGWGTTVNNGTFELVDNSIAGLVSVDVTSGDVTLTTASGATDQARYMFIRVFGASVARDVTVPATSKLYFVINDCTAAVTFKASGQPGVSIPAGRTAVLRCNGTDVVAAVTYLTDLALASALPVASGGTGQTTAQAAIDTLAGATTSGQYLRGNGSNVVMSAIQAGDVPTLNQNTTGTAANVTGTVAVANGGTGRSSFATNRVLYSASSSTVDVSADLMFDGSNNLLVGSAVFGTINNYVNGNTAAGYEALLNLGATGQRNTAVGYQVLRSITTGDYNVGMGFQSLNLSNGDGNVAVGHGTMSSAGSYNVAIGYNAGLFATGNNNVAVGRDALENASGDDNIGIGPDAGDLITTGNRNVIIGYDCDPDSASADDQIVIGISLTGKGNGTAFIGGANGAYNDKNVTTWETTSDERIKKNIVDNNVGLGVIDKIRVRNFEYRESDEIVDLPKHAVVRKGGVQLGVIAQELREVLLQSVYENSTGVLSINTDALIWHLINSVKELSARVRQLEGQQ